jgi:hypothetical protein
MCVRNILLAAVLLGWSAAAAPAATISYHVSFAAGNFIVDPAGPEPPILVLGSFDIDIDVGVNTPTDAFSLQNTSITALPTFPGNLDFPFQIDTPWSYTYDLANDILFVGGSAHGSQLIQFSPAENDFYLQIHDFSTAMPLMWQLGFAQSRLDGTQFYNPVGGATQDGFVFVSLNPVSTVPLPAGLPLFLTAMGAMGLAARLRKRRNDAAIATS